MKKTYIIPNMEVVKVAAQQQMLTTSTTLFGEGTKGGSEACGRENDDDFDW